MLTVARFVIKHPVLSGMLVAGFAVMVAQSSRPEPAPKPYNPWAPTAVAPAGQAQAQAAAAPSPRQQWLLTAANLVGSRFGLRFGPPPAAGSNPWAAGGPNGGPPGSITVDTGQSLGSAAQAMAAANASN